MSSQANIAQALARARQMGGQSGEPGLESPIEQRILENLSIAAGGYGAGNAGARVAQALVQNGLPMMQSLGQAGAIFPEGAPLPKDKALLQELGQILPESQQNFQRNKALADWHAQNQDFPRVLQDKWALLKNFGGN